MSFSTTLRAALDELNWQPVQLAAKMTERGTPIAVATIDRWLKEDRIPRIDLARQVADAMGISLDVLVPSDPRPKAACQ